MRIRVREFFKKRAAAILIAAALSVGLYLAYFAGVFDFLEYKLYDLRVNISAAIPDHFSQGSDEIILILLDQDSLDWAAKERGWGWPWPRAAYGELTDYLALGGAKSAAFDVIFSEPSVYNAANVSGMAGSAALDDSSSEVSDDGAFAAAAAEFGRTVQIAVFSGQTGNAVSWPDNAEKPLFSLRNFESIQAEYEKLNQFREGGGEVRALFPVKELFDAAGAVGNVTGWPDPDEIYRRNNLFTIFDGKAIPALSAASLLVAGESPVITYNEQKRVIEWGSRIIPVDSQGRTILRFRGGPDEYNPYWAKDVLQSAEDFRNGKTPLIFPGDFKDRYVFFGFYAQGLFDIFSTPINSVYPGVGVHVTMLDNMLRGDFIRESPAWFNVLFIVASVLVIVRISLFSRHFLSAVGGTVLALAVVIAAGMAAYHFASLWIPMAAPLFAVALAYLTTTVYNYATEGSKKRFIKSAFSAYLSPVVIDQIIADPSKLDLGGETRDMSAIFTDIQRFSSISEALQKEYGADGSKVLVDLLNLYLTELSNIVLANGGTIDKYEGDAIVAFFGAPVWSPDHASLACRSALSMKKREAELLDRIMDPALKFRKPLQALIDEKVLRPGRPLYTRLGVNSGDMVVGNMGTPNKMNYTIMGNAVNLAARLEGVNKQYDTFGILISEYTKDRVGDEFVVRGLSRVRVVGIETPIRLYELLERREEASAGLLDMVASWESGFRAYENRDFLAAKNIFSAIHQKNEADRVAKLYVERCDKFIAAPPLPEKWDDGVDSLTEK